MPLRNAWRMGPETANDEGPQHEQRDGQVEGGHAQAVHVEADHGDGREDDRLEGHGQEDGVGPQAEEAAHDGHRQAAHDLRAGHDGRGQTRDAVGVGVTVELQQVWLHGVEGVETDATGEGCGQHHPAHRAVAQATVDGAARDVARRRPGCSRRSWP